MSIADAIPDEVCVRPQPPPDEVRAQMQRILAGPTLQGSSARRELLRFIVEETLAGRAGRLKGFTIALAVFGRKDDFDPQTDPVVRVEARRLRRDLDSYYITAGKHDPVVISIPKGGYIPHLAWRYAETATDVLVAPLTQPRPRKHWFAAALIASAFVALLAGFAAQGLFKANSWPVSDGSDDAVTTLPRGPKIAVLPFQSLGGDAEQAYFAQGITDQIVTDLARFKALFVLSLQSTARHDEQTHSLETIRKKFGIDYLLTGSVQHDGSQIRLSTRLVEVKSQRIIWAWSYDEELSPSNVFEIQRTVSQQVSAILASSYGVIADVGQSEAQSQPPTSLSAYDCVLRYYFHERRIERREHAKVRSCLEHAVAVDPDYAEAWAVLANVYAQEYRFGYNPRPDFYDPLERSFAAARRAVEIEPRNPTAQLMLANALFDRHDLEGFQTAGEQAIALNPNDPETLAHYGTRLVYMGQWKRGLALVSKAIALNPESPEWYRSPLIFYDYQTGDYERALAESQRQEGSRVWRLLFTAMTLGQLGRIDEARPVIKGVIELQPDIRERFWGLARIWNVPDPHIERMADGLRKAGLAIKPATQAS